MKNHIGMYAHTQAAVSFICTDKIRHFHTLIAAPLGMES